MYKALVSFSGVISMEQDAVGDISDASVAEDLLRAGYIEKVTPKKKKKGGADDED